MSQPSVPRIQPPSEHYIRAHVALDQINDPRLGWEEREELVALAQVHATLATVSDKTFEEAHEGTGDFVLNELLDGPE